MLYVIHAVQVPNDSETLMATTQTAVVLAELAADDTLRDDSDVTMLSSSGFCSDPPVKIQVNLKLNILNFLLKTNFLSNVLYDIC